MSTAVKFENQSRFCTIKVYNIITYRLLSLETYRIAAQKIIPQFPFPRSHIFPQHLSQRDVLFIVSFHSLPPSKIKDFCHLPHQREALARCKNAHYALHRNDVVYRSAPFNRSTNWKLLVGFLCQLFNTFGIVNVGFCISTFRTYCTFDFSQGTFEHSLFSYIYTITTIGNHNSQIFNHCGFTS